MRRFTVLAVLAAMLVALAGCRTTLTPSKLKQIEQGSLVVKDLRSYHVVYSEYQGKVGYLKVYDVQEANGPTYQWKYVLDLEFNELGFVDQYGTAYRYHRYSHNEQAIHDKQMRLDHMPTDSLERNVMRMLEIDPALDNVSFPTASRGDLGG